MTDSLAVLLVEDIPADAELVERELRLAGLGVSCRRVGPRPELEDVADFAGFVHYARETNCQPIGEGVGREAQRQTLVGRVALGQGHLLWRPVPAYG